MFSSIMYINHPVRILVAFSYARLGPCLSPFALIENGVLTLFKLELLPTVYMLILDL